ncbi:conserved hypothetical protein [uncultured Pleomorphomonas sp.]|uniref:ASCH domain-containing protein n=1 Tax=uncultured Pleomorphomonas sp. TaxID=442121 RepID=A0A212LD54_9HYPH|nr:ASCH domain-containing protein [uncultured Pleomorphomonas sp.]SCM75417.1 conserved hypothetical protein [uncultured Pleomorphomonas sp.]
MVAYSFAPMFAAQVEALTKSQTVRGDRQRHARVGEPVQLYAGMRTRQCRKLVADDPICDFVAPIRIYVPEPEAPYRRPLVPADQVRIEIMGRELNVAETIAFAIADGFGCVRVQCEDKIWRGSGEYGNSYASPVSCFGAWWWQDHGTGWWSGVLIRWAPAQEMANG